MADLRKSLFKQDLDKYQVFVQDTNPSSKYFNVTELPDTFTGGKNAFLIQGSEYLVPDTLVRIELKDALGNVIYNEPGEGIVSASVGGESIVTEYYEGTSKVVAVYIYPDTAYGPCTLTILGELGSYDNNGLIAPIPVNWQGAYNVKWQKQINVNPSLANTTKIRFYRRPQATIKEILSPIYRIESGSKVNSGVNQSFADIRLKNLETFAGDVKRVKVFRTSQGDISDYDLIQDILVESKELLTSYDLTGSVVGQTGILTSETFPKFWNTGSLKTELTSSRVESGVKLSGSGNFTYTSSLDIKSGNTYELNLDAFYSSSTSSNLGIYLNQVTTSIENNVEVPIVISSSIATLVGTQPTKNLLDTTIPFKLDRNYPTASLYFSQSQGEWHLGNISLKLAQDTAFSPDEISFVTTMPSVIGNETYNFKFEFYDVNNNYVPVFVTQSALFTGGTNFNNIILSISSSVSESISGSSTLIYAVSQSISGTAALYLTSSVATASLFYTASIQTSSLYLTASIATASYSASVVSASVYTLSGSVSSSIGSLSSSVSQSIYNGLLSSFEKVQQLADGGYSGSFISGNIIYAPVIGGQLGYFSTLFKVGQSPNSIFLDARTNTRKIYVGGVNDTGSYNSGSTSVYMDSAGKFSLKDKLTWDGNTLSIDGNINIAGGSAATSLTNLNNSVSYINTATSSLNNSVSYINTATGSLQTQVNAADEKIFTNALGRIVKTPSTGSQAGLYLGNTNLGYYNGSAWKTYMDNTGLFYLTGSNDGNALLWDGSNLTIRGTIKVGGGQEVTSTTISNAANALQSGQTGKSLGLTGGSVGGVTIAPDKIYVGTGTYGNANTGFYVDSSGNMSLKDKLTWDNANSTLTVTGKIVITDGNAATTSSLASGLAGKINTSGAAADVNANSTTISGGKITTNTLTANQISSLLFTGKEARFDSGSIGGWTIDVNNINKIGSTHTMTLDSANNVWRIVENSNSQLRLAITGSTSIPPIAISSTDTVTFTRTSTQTAIAQADNPNIPVNQTNTVVLSPSSGRGDTCASQGYTGTGIVGLIYPTEEIWVDVSEMTPALFDSCVNVSSNDGFDDYVFGKYLLQLRVRKYANCTDAENDTNVMQTYTKDIAEIIEMYSYSNGGLYLSNNQVSVSDTTVQVNSNNNYFRIDLIETSEAYVSPGSYQNQTTSAIINRFNGSIVVRFGRVDNGYSVFGPGGLQVYQGVKSYLNASAAGDNFFEVKGKSAFLSGLYVSGTFSAQNKQFQITHPLDDKKWLYHTSLEAPRADLIYRGTLKLENGEGNVSIDSASNMTMGTFSALTKNSQLFLQNNESFDRIKGYVESGSVYVLSENENSTASIDWSVIAERNDSDLHAGPTYFKGNYKVERYKSEYADDIRLQLQSGSI